MKKSNQIIILVFALLVLIPALVVATILLKYRNGDFIREKSSDFWGTTDLKGANKICLQGLESVDIVPSETLRLEYDFTGHPALRFYYTNDSVFVKGDSSYTAHDTLKNRTVVSRDVHERHNRQVKLYIPSSSVLSLISCDAVIITDNKEITVDALQLNMQSGNLNFEERNNSVTGLKTLRLTGNATNIELSKSWKIDELNLDLKNKTVFRANEASIGSINLKIDSSSTVNLTGQQLRSIIQKK